MVFVYLFFFFYGIYVYKPLGFRNVSGTCHFFVCAMVSRFWKRCLFSTSNFSLAEEAQAE